MALVSSVVWFLLFLTPTETCNLHGLEGGSIVVPLSTTNYQLKESDRLEWSRNEITIFVRKNSDVKKGTTGDVDASGFLKLHNLAKSHSGEYKPKMFDKNGKAVGGNLKTWSLCVLAPVQKPNVTLTCMESLVNFTCHVNEIPEESFVVSWLRNEKVEVKASDNVHIREAKQVKKDSFSCNVSNPVSFAVSEPVTQTCYEPFFFEDVEIWVFVGGGGGVVLLLLVIVIVCCIRAKHSRRRQIKEEAELRLDWANSEQQQQHHHHHHHQSAHPENPPDHHHKHPRHHHHPHLLPHRPLQQPAGHTGPRKHRQKQRPRSAEAPGGQPLPNRQKTPRAADGEKPPPLPNPRNKGLRSKRVLEIF